MDAILLIPVLAPIAALAGAFSWAARRARQRGMGGVIVGPFQEMWDPAGARTRVDVEIRAQEKAPAPSPGDPPKQ